MLRPSPIFVVIIGITEVFWIPACAGMTGFFCNL